MFEDPNINNPLWYNGPKPGQIYNFPGSVPTTNGPDEKINSVFLGKQRTSQPITTGTSVLGVKFYDGVVIAADTLLSYGSTARYRNVDRVYKINDKIILGIGGDFGDFQYIKRFIDQKVLDDYCFDDKITLKPKSLYNWLTRVFYNRRCNFSPLWLDIIVGGMQNDVPFLGHIDMRGRAYEDSAVATGYGKHIALPLLREVTEDAKLQINQMDKIEKDSRISQQDKELIREQILPKHLELIRNSMETLYYRDARSYPQFTQGICTRTQPAYIDGPINVPQKWDIAHSVTHY